MSVMASFRQQSHCTQTCQSNAEGSGRFALRCDLEHTIFGSTFQDVHVGHDQNLLQGHPFVINEPHHVPLVGSNAALA
jgi:hypothetical protein